MKLICILAMVFIVSCGKNKIDKTTDDSNGLRAEERPVKNPNRALFNLRLILNKSVLSLQKMVIDGQERELEQCSLDDRIFINSDGSFNVEDKVPCEDETENQSGSYEVFIQAGNIIMSMTDADGNQRNFTLISYGTKSMTLRTIEQFGTSSFKVDITYSITKN